MSGTKYLVAKGDRFLRIGEVVKIIALSRSQTYLLISKGEFPKQYKLGERAAGWLESEILDWMSFKLSGAANSGKKETK